MKLYLCDNEAYCNIKANKGSYRNGNMKNIDTEDSHIGKILNGKSFIEDQSYIIESFIKTMIDEQPDVIVIAGDLYDTSYPNKEAIQLLESTINTLNLEMNM